MNNIVPKSCQNYLSNEPAQEKLSSHKFSQFKLLAWQACYWTDRFITPSFEIFQFKQESLRDKSWSNDAQKQNTYYTSKDRNNMWVMTNCKNITKNSQKALQKVKYKIKREAAHLANHSTVTHLTYNKLIIQQQPLLPVPVTIVFPVVSEGTAPNRVDNNEEHKEDNVENSHLLPVTLKVV